MTQATTRDVSISFVGPGAYPQPLYESQMYLTSTRTIVSQLALSNVSSNVVSPAPPYQPDQDIKNLVEKPVVTLYTSHKPYLQLTKREC